jgi:hypothetical protein
MLKPKIINTLLFWLIKYIVFYIFLMFKSKNYGFLKVQEIKNGEDLFYYLWLFLFLPVVCMIIFTVPMYYLFKTNRLIYCLLIWAIIIIVEYLCYTYLASQADLLNGVYNAIISVLVLYLLFYKHINNLYNQRQVNGW